METTTDKTRHGLFGRVARKLPSILAILLFAHVTLSAGLYWAMRQPPDAFGRIMAWVPMVSMLVLPFETLWNHARAGVLRPGDPAPDFQLSTMDHRETFRLSSLRGSRPVVLVFGSYT